MPMKVQCITKPLGESFVRENIIVKYTVDDNYRKKLSEEPKPIGI